MTAAKNNNTRADHVSDVLIVGGGLAGMTLACVLGQAGLDVTIVDRETPPAQTIPHYDGRTTAISWASHRVLQAAGVWADMLPDAAPILDIRVADGAAPVFLHFSADAHGDGNPFGWIIENRLMRMALFKNINRLKKNVRHMAPATVTGFFSDDAFAGVTLEDGRKLAGRLMIGADGRQSPTRQWLGIGVKSWSYEQSAIVCNVAHEADHESVAVEHFLPAGPFAVLPMTNDDHGAHRSSVVWTVESKDAASFLSLPEKEFDAALQKLFGPHLGRVRHVSKPMQYPLSLMHADRYTGPRTLLMAEAAHVIHPIAGQGLNLSMRDIAVIAELVVDAKRNGIDIGTAAVLDNYEQWRRPDILMMAGFTDGLNRLFSNPAVTAAAVRDLGLGIIEKIGPLKGFFARQAMGLGGKTPRIVRDGGL